MAKRAIIFVHGIGEQQRYLMRDGLANAIEASGIGGIKGGTLAIDVPGSEDPPKSIIGRTITRGAVTAEIFEVYWAPRLSGKTKTPSVLRWMLGATFLPGVALRRPSGKTLIDVIQLLLYGVVAAFIALVALNTLGNLTAFVECATKAPTAQKADTSKECDPKIADDSYINVAGDNRNLVDAFATFGRQIDRAVVVADRPLSDLTPDHAGEVLRKLSIFNWLGMMVLGWLGAQVLYRLRQFLTGQRLPQQVLAFAVVVAGFLILFTFLSPTLSAFVLILLAVTAAIKVGSRFLAESLGDVQVYAERDENSELFAAREAVLSDFGDVVAAIDAVKDGAAMRYEEVVIVAHSLGAVITFDVLTDAVLPDEFRSKVKALITIGSALEKVRYFFDKRSAAPQEREVLVGKALTKTGQGRLWVNVWYLLDWVANPIRASVGTEPVVDHPWDAKQNPFPWIEEDREKLVINLRPTGKRIPFPPSHSAYLKDKQVRRLVASLALAPELTDVGAQPWT